MEIEFNQVHTLTHTHDVSVSLCVSSSGSCVEAELATLPNCADKRTESKERKEKA